MKKLEKLQSLKIEGNSILGGQCKETRYWDTCAGTGDGEKRDHECPNGNILIELK